jgi:hypothetical protein
MDREQPVVPHRILENRARLRWGRRVDRQDRDGRGGEEQGCETELHGSGH